MKKIQADNPNESQEDSPEKTKSMTSEDDVDNVQTRDISVDPVIAKLKSAKVNKIHCSIFFYLHILKRKFSL